MLCPSTRGTVSLERWHLAQQIVWVEFDCLFSPFSPLPFHLFPQPWGIQGPLCTHVPRSISAALGRWEQGTFLKMASRIFSLTWVMVSQFRIFTGISGLFTLSGFTQLRTWERGMRHHKFHSNAGTLLLPQQPSGRSPHPTNQRDLGWIKGKNVYQEYSLFWHSRDFTYFFFFFRLPSIPCPGVISYHLSVPSGLRVNQDLTASYELWAPRCYSQWSGGNLRVFLNVYLMPFISLRWTHYTCGSSPLDLSLISLVSSLFLITESPRVPVQVLLWSVKMALTRVVPDICHWHTVFINTI